VPTVESPVEALGFKFADVKILLGNHAHGDHPGGRATGEGMTAPRLIEMAEDVPRQKIKPGGKEHPLIGHYTMAIGDARRYHSAWRI